MAFWGTLANIGKGLLGFGGGNAGDIASKVAEKLGGVGQVMGNAAQGAADQRLQEQFAHLQNQGLQQVAARDQFDAGLGGAKFASDERSLADQRGMKAALLSNLQDVNISGMNPKIQGRMPQISGGLRPSALTGGGQREALMAMLQQPGQPAPTFQGPSPLQLQGQSTGEKVMGGIGLGTSILGALNPWKKPGTAA
jgi:hypothetical protein